MIVPTKFSGCQLGDTIKECCKANLFGEEEENSAQLRLSSAWLSWDYIEPMCVFFFGGGVVKPLFFVLVFLLVGLI